MATITEDYVSFEIAKLLKEKGFNGKCSRWYVANEPQEGIVERGFGENQFYINAPTHQMVMKWLREVHKIYLNINVRVILGQWSGYDISVYTTDNDGFLNKNIPVKLKDNLSYEQAVEAAIKYVLEKLI